MDSLLAIGVGLVLRIVVDAATDDDRVGGVLVGLWEGVVLNHFMRRMPRSFDPYLGFGFRIFVDFLFTQSLSRLALVALWALVGMLLADIAPNVWRDSGLRHLYRQVRKDVRHVQRAVPRIRIKNDLPSVRLFDRPRSTSGSTSSMRSDRAAPSRSPAPSPAPTPRPARRLGRSPPGTYPNVSGWSETGTDVSSLRENIVSNLGPSPALIPSQEIAARMDTTHVATPQMHVTTVQDTTITITQTQNESVLLETNTVVEMATVAAAAAVAAAAPLEPIEDPSRHDPPTIPDDWVDVNPPAPAQANEPIAAFEPDPDSTPEVQPGPSILTPSRPASILEPPPAIDVLPDIPDVDKVSRPPDLVPLPESRAASVIGGVFDQPEPRGAVRDSFRSRFDKATSELGMPPSKPLARIAVARSTTKRQTTSRGWFGSSWVGTKLASSTEADTPDVPPKVSREEPSSQGKADEGGSGPSSEPPTTTPAQVDPPANILTQPGDATPLLLASVEPESERTQGSGPAQAATDKLDQKMGDEAGVDSSPVPPPGEVDAAGPSKMSLLDLPSPTRTPPPPFTEFAGVGESVTTGDVPAAYDPVTQDEAEAELTEEQKAVEERRIAFLGTQVKELEKTSTDLRGQLEKEDDPDGSPAKALESDAEDSEKTLSAIKARMEKKKFSRSLSSSSIQEVSLANKSALEAQSLITAAIMNTLLERDDAEPITIQVVINKQKPLKAKAKEAKEAVTAFSKRHKFTTRSESATPGIVNITF